MKQRLRMNTMFIFLTFLVSRASLQAKTAFVPSDTADANGGNSRTNAFTNLRTSVAAPEDEGALGCGRHIRACGTDDLQDEKSTCMVWRLRGQREGVGATSLGFRNRNETLRPRQIMLRDRNNQRRGAGEMAVSARFSGGIVCA